MSQNGSIEILGLGCVAVDDLLYFDSYPQPDTKVPVKTRQRQCGGLTGNALVAAARLGANCAYAGTLGEDVSSRFVLDTFQREGVNTSLVRIQAGARPIRSTILVDQGSHTRTVLFDLSGTVGASVDWPPQEAIEAAKAIYVDHYGMDGMIRAARIARAAGVAVVSDLERNEWLRFEELLSLVDHLVVNRAFACKLTGRGAPRVAALKLWNLERRCVIVTCGPEGCWWIGEGSADAVHQPVFAVNVVDTTGCGDVFHGAYAAALVRGLNLEERVRVASAAAAIKATRLGGQAGSPTWEEVSKLLGCDKNDI